MKKIFLTCFGLGNMPIAPGTWGSLPVAAVFLVLAMFAQPVVVAGVMAVVAIASSAACVKFSPDEIAKTGKKDPSFIVIDEVAGQAVTFLIACWFCPENLWVAAGAGFLLFRVFDIFKPWPCKKLEKLPGGVGILADDLMAGVYAGLLLLVFSVVKAHFKSSPEGEIGGFSGMTLLFSGILGAVQGLTEFLPVSSSGHLVFLEHFIAVVDPESKQMLLFDLVLHVGTVGSILVVFRERIRMFVVSLFKVREYGCSPKEWYQKNASVRFMVLAMITTVVTVVLYALFKDKLESARQLIVLAVTWSITGAVLFLADMKQRGRRSLKEFGILCAVIIGIAQTCAILPGISRSGATICAAVLLGLHRRWAIDYSFLISIPVILGGALLEFVKDPGLLTSGALSLPVVLVGILSSFIIGIISLKILIAAFKKRKLKYFSLYCFVLAIFVVVYVF